MWYGYGEWVYGLFQIVFFFAVPALLFLILFLLYHNFYTKNNGTPSFGVLYAKTMIRFLSFVSVFFLAKMWDDLIDRHYTIQSNAISQQQNYYIDLYGCHQRFWFYEYQWAESKLTPEQIETCHQEQLDIQQKYTSLEQNTMIFKSIYRLVFFVILLLVHIVIYYYFTRNKD
jgi:hypothetical protein